SGLDGGNRPADQRDLGNRYKGGALTLRTCTVVVGLVLASILHPSDRPRLQSQGEMRRHTIVDLEAQARTFGNYFPTILEAAKQSEVDARVVAAVIVVET